MGSFQLSPLMKQVLMILAMALVAGGVKVGFDLAFRKPFGQFCTSAQHCRSGLCSSQGYCTQTCKIDSDCPQGYTCWDAAITHSVLEFRSAREGTPLPGAKKARVCR